MSRYGSYAKFGSGVYTITQSSGMDSESSSRRWFVVYSGAQHFCPWVFTHIWSQAPKVTIFRSARMVRNELARIIFGGLRVFALLVLFVGAPLILGWILSLVLYFLTFGLLGVVAYLPLAITGFFAPMFFLSAFMAYLKNEEFQDALQFRRITQQVIHGWKPLALPIVAFWGIFLLALPIYGLSFFIGAWILIAYAGVLRMKNFS